MGNGEGLQQEAAEQMMDDEGTDGGSCAQDEVANAELLHPNSSETPGRW